MPNILYTIIIYPLVQIIEFVFVFSQKIFKEPGISVIFISGAVSVLCLPLYNVAEAWQDYERALQKKFRPKINAIKAVFSGDERFLILSTYYRQNHYHPVFALRSTFSLAIQVPFFIAAYSYLSGLEALKGASFLFISDMGVPDALFSLGGGVTLNLLPLIMTAVNCAAGAVYTRGFPLKDKVQLYGMAAVFLLLLYNSPSGLVIYWTTNNLFSLFKNIYHKISYGYKTHILAACISALCLFMVYFILFLHKGEQQQRHIIALFSIILAIVPWALIAKTKAKSASRPPVLKNHSKSVSSRETVLFMLSAAALWVLAGLWIPSTLIVSSPDEFSYIDSYASPLFFIANTALQAFGLFVFWPLCLFFLFSGGRASSGMKKLFTFLAFLLFTGALCNTFGFPGNYGLISQSLQFANTVDHPRPELLLNMAVLCFAALAAAFLFSKKLYAFLFPFPAIIMAALLVLASVNLISIQKAYASLSTIHPGNGQKLAEARPLFTLSRTGKNTVIIMLDRASSSFFPFILEEDPALLDEYSGFVYYPNTVSFNGYTSAGAPPIFGGYEYTPEAMNKRDGEPMVQKHNEALLLLPRIFSEAGYQVTVTDPPYPNYSNKNDLGIYDSIPNVKAYITDSKYTALWLEEHNLRLPSMGDILRRDILWYSLLRISPPVIRRAIYQRGDWCSSIPGQKLTGFLNGYAVLDYLPALTDIIPDTENTALIMVNNTTHDGALLQAPEYRPTLNVVSYGSSPFKRETEYHINIAAFKCLAEWFAFLKQENVYDNTRIILVSDHGSQISYVTKAKKGMPENFDNLHPMLLVKDFNAGGRLKTDNAFMSNADVPFLALAGQIENPVNPFTGKEITISAKKQPLYIAVSASVHLENPKKTRIGLDPQKDWYVHDNIFDPANWTPANLK